MGTSLRGDGAVSELLIGIAGSGGDGVVSAGESLTSAAALAGCHVIMTKSFGSQIRGGESSCRIRVSTEPIFSAGGPLDVAVALNWTDFARFGSELAVDGKTIFVHDSSDRSAAPPSATNLIEVPISEIAQHNGGERAKNIVVLGLLAGWFGVAVETVRSGIHKRFAKKGAAVLESAERAFGAALEYTAAHPLPQPRTFVMPAPGAPAMLLSDGNDMCAAGAIFAGCEFFGGYPITPSTEIMQFLSREIWSYGGALLQAEDEIAGIGSAIGASFAGKKAMTATSGPGMSLKTEMLGLASIAELPLVIVNVQRGGPSTGMPTKSEQADLFQAVFSAHGDVIRPVLAPTSVSDTFSLTVEAFNLAERFQTPVVLLSDQEIAQRKESLAPIDTRKLIRVERLLPSSAQLQDYRRFRCEDDSISPISRPGMAGGSYQAGGIEHSESGAPSASGAIHQRMTEKRFHKFDPLHARRDLFLEEGDPEAELALIGWGSSAGICREALQLAQRQGLRAKLLVPLLLYPVIDSVYQRYLDGVSGGLVVEQSYQGQLFRILRMFVDLPRGLQSLARAAANPLQPVEIIERLRQCSLAPSVEAAA